MTSLWSLIVQGTKPSTTLTVHHGEATVHRMSDVLDQAEHTARQLCEAHPAGLPRRIGVLMPNGETWVRAALAAWRLGAALVPLPLPTAFAGPDAYTDHLARIAQSGELDILAVDTRIRPQLRQRVTAALSSLTCTDVTAVRPSQTQLPRPVGSDCLAVIQFTSGSTSHPKGVALTHRNIRAGLDAIAGAADWGDQDILGLWLPLFHDMGLFTLLTALTRGTTTHLWQPQEAIRRPAAWLRQFAEVGATMTTAPNFFYDRLLAAAQTDPIATTVDLSRLRYAVNGSEPVRAQTVHAFASAFAGHGLNPYAMRPAYGLAEATLMVTCAPLNVPIRHLYLDRDRLKPGDGIIEIGPARPTARTIASSGIAAPGVRLQIGEADGSPLPERTVGEIQVAGTAITTGYYALPPEQQPTTPNGWLRTGDLGFLAEGHLYVTGRLKTMIILAGRNVFAEDIEEVVRTTPGVDGRRCAALVPGTTCEGSERVAVRWESDQPAHETQAVSDLIARRLQEQVGVIDVDVQSVPAGTIPATTSGKVKRSAMML